MSIMALRRFPPSFRRMFSGTTPASAPEKLPFEKPIFESDILRKAQQERDSYQRLEFIGNSAIVLVGISCLLRIGYYIRYGKEGGAEPLPKRGGR